MSESRGHISFRNDQGPCAEALPDADSLKIGNISFASETRRATDGGWTTMRGPTWKACTNGPIKLARGGGEPHRVVAVGKGSAPEGQTCLVEWQPHE